MTIELERAILVWPLVAALATAFGTAGFTLLSAEKPLFGVEPTAAALLGLWRLLAVTILFMSPLLLLNITAEMAGVSWRGAWGFAPEVLAETHAGHVFQWYLPIALALFVSAFAPLPHSIRTATLFLGTGVLLLLQALLSHAIDRGSVAVAIYFLHELAAGLWIGALLALWLVAWRGNPAELWIVHAARRASQLAFWSVLVLIVSGIYTAYLGLGSDLYHLLYSSYGRVLLAKVTLFVGVLLIGAYNRYWLMPNVSEQGARTALLRNVQLESVILLVAVIGLAALLANTPPAHGMGNQGSHAMMAMAVADPIKRGLWPFRLKKR